MKQKLVVMLCIFIVALTIHCDTLDDLLLQLHQNTTSEAKDTIRAILNLSPSYNDLSIHIHSLPYTEPYHRGLIRKERKSLDGILRHYYCYVPKTYSPAKPSALIIWLHGGVNSEKILELDEKHIRETMFGQYAEKTGAILLYPQGQKNATWWDDVGIDTIFSTLRQTKIDYNIDDNRITLMGFSDGASGTFGIAMLNPEPFSCFIPLNGHPAALSLLGGYHTYLLNLSNRPMHVVTTDNDELFPDKLLRPIMGAAVMAGAQISYKIYTNMRHELNYGEEEVPRLIRFIETHPRIPFPPTIRWETADPRFGRCMWISIDSIIAKGHEEWYQDYTIKEETGRIFFRRDKASARVEATVIGNTFFVMASQCARFSIFIHPDMIQLDQPIIIYCNNKKVFDASVKPDINFTLENYNTNRDKALLYCAKITVTIP